jgi:hypothetical protein
MSTFLGPLDAGHIPSHQQTRVGAFLASLHGALGRRLALGLPVNLRFGWETELHSQLHREAEIATLMLRATSWVADFELPGLWVTWEMAWLPRPVEGITDLRQGQLIDLASLAHAAHGAIRPAALLPPEADPKGRIRVGAATDRVREFAADPGSNRVSEGTRAHLAPRSSQFGGRATASTSARALGGDADEYRRAAQNEELALACILLLITDVRLSPSISVS